MRESIGYSSSWQYLDLFFIAEQSALKFSISLLSNFKYISVSF